ncbi:hypothetical protein [Nonomuraea sp. NPDC050202]|uniref:hypothetical protein n=1 Tax=Nonomuraea sp. NPDC050202 TaxID=3155035 RepID=UPI0033C26C28
MYADSAREYGMNELGTAPDLAKSSLTRLVDRSERHDLVQREPAPQDSGAARVAFTGRGGELTGDFHAGDLPHHRGTGLGGARHARRPARPRRGGQRGSRRLMEPRPTH